MELFADGHVHIYPFMSVENVLNAASRNFFGSHENTASGYEIGILLVADPAGVRGYDRLLDHGQDACRDEECQWLPTESSDRSVTFQHASGRKIIAVRGQQLITTEGLEVLGIGQKSDLSSGLALPEMLEGIRAAGGWSIIAWGVGKWTGRRGRLVTEMVVSESQPPSIMLVDNGGRPWLWSRVPQFEVAKEHGVRVLAGTDPLPLKGEESRIGSYGFRMSVDHGPGEPVIDSFCRALEDPSVPTHAIGTQMGIGRFASNQIRIRLT